VPAIAAVGDDIFTNNTTSNSGMCEIGVMGDSSGTTYTTAVFSPISYTCSPGTYLPADGIECATCPTGKYCEGGTYEYNETTAQGATNCPSMTEHQCTEFPANFYNPTITPIRLDFSGLKSITECTVFYRLDNVRGQLYARGKYNATTEKYDRIYDSMWYAVKSGYYLTTKSGCGSYAYYREAFECPAGSYCPGKSVVICNSENAETVHTTTFGLESCLNDYPNSATGATAQNQCYTACTTANLPSATAVIGNDYYGDGVDTCAPANSNSCTGGYHYVGGFDPATDNLPATESPDAVQATSYIARNNSGNYCNHTTNICKEDSDWTAQQLATFVSSGIQNNEWRITYGNGSVTGEMRGVARCSTQSGTGAWSNPAAVTPADVTTRASVTASFETGRYCWCQPTSWTATGGTMQGLYAPWVFAYDFYGTCASGCARYCVHALLNNAANSLVFRSAVFGAITKSIAQCTGNTITLNWGGNENEQPQQTMCTYGGGIDTPTTAPTKRGHTFLGWRFVAPSND